MNDKTKNTLAIFGFDVKHQYLLFYVDMPRRINVTRRISKLSRIRHLSCSSVIVLTDLVDTNLIH